MPLATLRNIAIILVIAALVVIVPGGGTATGVALQAASLLFLAVLAWFAAISYRQHRTAIYSLGDRRRALLYLALAVGALTLTATSRLWHTSGGSVAWLILVGAAVYVLVSTFLAARRY